MSSTVVIISLDVSEPILSALRCSSGWVQFFLWVYCRRLISHSGTGIGTFVERSCSMLNSGDVTFSEGRSGTFSYYRNVASIFCILNGLLRMVGKSRGYQIARCCGPWHISHAGIITSSSISLAVCVVGIAYNKPLYFRKVSLPELWIELSDVYLDKAYI